MAQPPYVLNLARFEELCASRGFKTRTDFIDKSGIPRRTFAAVLAAEGDVKMTTVAFFLDAFPGTTFETLFSRTETGTEKLAA